MKTITVSDEDYDLLMELSKELKTQENDWQAFPYFWSPKSDHYIESNENHFDKVVLFDTDDCEEVDIKEYAVDHIEFFNDFVEDYNENCALGKDIDLPPLDDDSTDEEFEAVYSKIKEDEWFDYIYENRSHIEKVYTRKDGKVEHNFSLFKSDVKQFCETNKHHLGENPHTYSQTVWRMPKMISLIKAIYRINTTVEPSEINHECARYLTESEYPKC